MRARKKIKLAIQAFILLAIVTLFNNCGQGFTSSEALTTSQSVTPPQSTPTPTPTPTPTVTVAPPAPPVPVPTGASITNFQLIAGSTGLLPFTLGMPFAKGAVPQGASLDIANGQVLIMRRWNDGSAKHAIISGHVNLTANQSQTVNVIQGAYAARTNLTATDVAAAKPQATVTIGALGTVNLADLLATPLRTFVSGPEMVEAHYFKLVGGVAVFFHVRFFKNGKIWVRVSAENGFVDVTGSDKNYTATVIVGGATVFNGAVTHYNHTRWVAEGWIGGDPLVVYRHNTPNIVATKLVPNYLMRTPSAEALASLYQIYVPYQAGNWTPDMSNTGAQDQIGILPRWDALYISSGGDSTVLKSVVANAKAIGSYPIIWRGSSDNYLPARPSIYQNYTVEGANGGGDTQWAAGSLNWDVAHKGSAGYLPYLVTGDYLFLEDMQHQASMDYLMTSWVDHGFTSTGATTTGFGVNRVILGQVRGAAWSQRDLVQLAGIAPIGDLVAADFIAESQNIAIHFAQVSTTPNINQLGILYDYDLFVGNGFNGPGTTGVFMHDFWVQTYGFGGDIEPFTDMTAWNTVRNWAFKLPVGLLGSGAAGTYCFNYASEYAIKVAAGIPAQGDLVNLYSWPQVFQATVPGGTCANTLTGTTTTPVSYWANLMPAIAYAVDNGAPGAKEAWARMVGATNWSEVINSNFADMPAFGVTPRP